MIWFSSFPITHFFHVCRPVFGINVKKEYRFESMCIQLNQPKPTFHTCFNTSGFQLFEENKMIKLKNFSSLPSFSLH